MTETTTEEAQPETADPREQLNGAAVNFNIGTLNAPHSTLGMAERPSTQLRADTGRLDEPEIAEELTMFVAPGQFDEALARLTSDHAVVLQGDVGTGKRLAAIALLREVTDSPLSQLNPNITLEELAEREYVKDCGYIVVNRMVETRGADTDFTWRTVRDRVRDHGAFLVVTATSRSGKQSAEAVAHVDWEQPCLQAVLRSHLATFPDAIIDELLESWPGCRRLADVAEVTAAIRAGTETKDALGLLDNTSLEEVRNWFATSRTRQEILSVTALAFLEGVSQRIFERHLAALTKQFEPAELVDEQEPVDLMPQNRLRLYPENGLIDVVRTGHEGVARHQVQFVDHRYRQHVLAELWRQEHVEFWDAVHSWLPELVVDYGLQVAGGLADLAKTAFDEVDSVLWPWSDGKLGWPGQIAATYVLWFMSFDDTLAPEALRRATQWANGTPARRWTAAVSFSRVLGVRYPHEAAKREWQLIRQSQQVDGDACLALADLFQTLTEETNDAGIVLAMLDTKLAQLKKKGVAPRLRKITMTAIVNVLSARQWRSRRSAAIAYLCARREKAGVLGRLWAAAVRNYPTRQRALIALRDGLKDLKEISDQPNEVARELGIALSNSLPPADHEQLRRDIASLNARYRKDASPLIDQLLDAITKNCQEKEPG